MPPLCPACAPRSYFCSQACFKSAWAEHKAVHKRFKEILREVEAKRMASGKQCVR